MAVATTAAALWYALTASADAASTSSTATWAQLRHHASYAATAVE
jgi:hypothetical protein